MEEILSKNMESDNLNSLDVRDVTADTRYLLLCELRLKLNHIADELTFYEKKEVR